ncbi:unnamed protein product [Rotaria sp. Silwood2]|nr:unnamed protein product [Rotaria sp. Silwood2]CAF2955533.1 unnamed protein product [Rotaria sp. Silwood2]CAF3099567.1 unnamed protein product [Rotaria sp. Silwood2]CAF3315361.1 unnamed protein product [Rotaria sp. Silwood2]
MAQTLYENHFIKQSSQHNINNYSLIVLDPKIDELNLNKEHVNVQLNTIISTTKIYINVDKCVDSFIDVNNEFIFLTLSNIHEENFIAIIHDMPQIYSIYVYYDGKIRDNEVIKKFHKVKGIYTDLSSIFDSFKNDIRRYEENLISTSIMPNTNISKVNLNELDPSYMYTKLLKEVLLKLDFDEHQRKYFVALSRGFYGNNTKILQTVDEFERDYQSDASIRWYPRSRFLYEMLNRAL